MKNRGFLVIVAQLVRAPVCGTGGRGFNSPRYESSTTDEASIVTSIVVTQVVQTSYILRTDFVHPAYIVDTKTLSESLGELHIDMYIGSW